MAGDMEVKGLALHSVASAMAELRGDAFKERAVQGMSIAEARDGMRYGGVIASGWYPASWYRDLLRSAIAVEGLPSFAREIGRTSTKREIKGVHRLLFKVVSIESLIKISARFFGGYFRNASFTVEALAPGMVRTHHSDCRGFDSACWNEQIGVIEQLIVEAGVKSPRYTRISGGGDGDHGMVVEWQWR